MPYLQILKGSNPGRIDLAGDRVVIGRSPDCSVVLAADEISRHHMQIIRDGKVFLIEDLQSRNGTYVNGTRITRPTPLLDSACIMIGENLLTFHSGTVQPEKPEIQLVVTEDQGNTSNILSTRDASSTDTVLMNLEVRPEAKLRAVLEISQNLRSAVRLDDVLPKVLDGLFKMLPQADHGSILLNDEAGNRLVPKALKNRRESEEKSLRVSRTIVQHVFENGQAVLLSDESRNAQLHSASIEELCIRSIMCVPLLSHKNKTLGIIQVHTEDRRHPFTQEDLDVLVSVASTASIALENAQLHEELVEQERLQSELKFAREVQRRFLPPTLPEVTGYGFYAYYEAAYSIGGDYYGFIDLPDNRLAISLGDVAGKGIPAALLMAHLSSDIRFSAITAADPAAAVGFVKRSLIEAGLDDKFITLLFMVLDKANHTLSLGNAGHLPPILRTGDGNVRNIGEDETGLPLNVNLEFDYTYKTYKMALDPGSTVLLYTDGVTEAMNPAGELFGSHRLEQAFKNAPADPALAGEAVIREVRNFAVGRHQSDDITLLCFGRVEA